MRKNEEKRHTSARPGQAPEAHSQDASTPARLPVNRARLVAFPRQRPSGPRSVTRLLHTPRRLSRAVRPRGPTRRFPRLGGRVTFRPDRRAGPGPHAPARDRHAQGKLDRCGADERPATRLATDRPYRSTPKDAGLEPDRGLVAPSQAVSGLLEVA